MEKVRLINISQNLDISDFVDSIDIVMPNTNEISSMVAKFTLEQKLIDTGNEIKIDVLDDIGNTIYSLNGEAKLLAETLNYTNLHNYSYEVKDSYSKLFEKNIAETQVFYDLYLCNNADVNNSLMHIIARNLGFKKLDFHNALYENSQYIRVPFVIFRENEKWIDELQSLIAATNSVLYITAGKLFFKLNNFTLNSNVIFDKTNIITRISRNYKATENNGVKVLYDRYKKLENQVVFNLKSKITVEKNTNKDTEVKSMRISYITSSVAEPSITKATGYYFRTHGDVNSKVDVDLIRDTHYVLEEFTETQAIVKFYNPFNYDLIIDNFEIKGIPLVMYTDNSAIVKNKIVVEKNQENFNIVNKNKYIQTPELAINIAKQIYRSNISSQFSYNLDTSFINNLQLGDVYNLAFENIDIIGRLISYTIQLRPSDFRLSLKLDEIGTLDNVALSYTDSLNSNSQYIDLSNVEKSIEENKQELSSIKSNFESLEQSIQDSKTKIYTLKPAMGTLTDNNIGDMYISDSSAEILVKENNNFVWKSITDSSVRADLNEYIKSNNAKVIDIAYQNTEPENPKNGDIWIDTSSDGIWKRYTNNAWIQIDESVRTAIATANTNISEIENKIKTINNTIDNKILAKAFVQEEQPTSGMKNHDIWYKPSNNSFKKWLNNRWNTATENDIFPALRHYVSLATAQLDIGKRIDGVDEKAGMFLTNNNTKFGAKNGTLAEVSLSKTGEILIKNANNLIQWNVKDPTSNKMKSRFLMGVQNVDTVPAETYFKIGDEATGFSLELKEGSSIAKIDGQDLGAKFKSVDTKMTEEQERVTLISLMSTGKMLYTDPEFKNGMNDIKVYNNAGTTVISHTRELRQSTNTLFPPNSSGYTINIRNAGTINATTVHPGAGGFYFGTSSRKEAVFITRIIARIPIGWKINFASNGTGGQITEKWLTSQDGTGKYEEYIFYLKCGSSTTPNDYSTTNFFFLTHSSNNYQAFTWYLAYATVFDCTANRDEKIYEVDGKVDANKNDVDRNINNLSKGISDSLNTAKSYADTKKTEIENILKKEITFEVGGEADKYYPVWFRSTNKLCNLVVYRKYSEKAPNSWNTATHKGSLFLELTTNFGSDWDGNISTPVIHKFEENYTTVASKIMIVHRPGILIWLRGGGAVYHTYTNDFETNKNLNVEVLLQGYDNPPHYNDYPQTIEGRAGTYAETGSASSIKALYTKEQISAVDRKLTNADGRLTQLQQNYQNTVQDVTNFKTRTADRIDTVQGALDNGNFVVNGNTTFADGVRFVSRGTNEVITIANGSIDFHRDGQKLTRIKNIRYGTCSTNSTGSKLTSIVNFEGFKQPMLLLTSIKSANFGKNMASVFCYAEHIRDCMYKIYVGGTNEHYAEAKPIKVVGRTWTTQNAVKATLLHIHFETPKIALYSKHNNRTSKEKTYITSNIKTIESIYEDIQKDFGYAKEYIMYMINMKPKGEANNFPREMYFFDIQKNSGSVVYEFNVWVNDEKIISQKIYSRLSILKGRKSGVNQDEDLYGLPAFTFDKELNIIKKYQNRTNLTIRFEFKILTKDLIIREISKEGINTRNGNQTRITVIESSPIYAINDSYFINSSITASAETSTLSDVTGEGEVQYIAMEID